MKVFPSGALLLENGTLEIKGAINFPVKFTNPRITPREWLTLFFLEIDKNNCKDKTIISNMERSFCQSRTTKWRTTKSLKKKGLI